MNFPQWTHMRNSLTLAFICVLLFSTFSMGADEAELRIADDCVIPLVRITPGKFEMGRSSRSAVAAAALSFGEQGDWATEGPAREVTISKAYLVGKYKITAEQFCRFLNSIDSPEQFVSINQFSSIEKRKGVYYPKKGRKTYPINVVHWAGATAFCQWLSESSGRTVRLPTEAEWEYAARGVEGRRTPWGKKEVAAWSSTKGSSVDAYPENSTPDGVTGLIDHVVGEWCGDFYGVRYIPSATVDPKGPSKEELPVRSDLASLATVDGEYHVLRGRVKRSNWSTTSRELGDRADNSGIYGFRIVVESDEIDIKP